MIDLKETLNARGKTHGDYVEMSETIQHLKHVIRGTPNWNMLTSAQRETLDSLALKLGRVLTGDPNFAEHWLDIAGYATRMHEVLSKPRSAEDQINQSRASLMKRHELVRAYYSIVGQTDVRHILPVVAPTEVLRNHTGQGVPEFAVKHNGWAGVVPADYDETKYIVYLVWAEDHMELLEIHKKEIKGAK